MDPTISLNLDSSIYSDFNNWMDKTEGSCQNTKNCTSQMKCCLKEYAKGSKLEECKPNIPDCSMKGNSVISNRCADIKKDRCSDTLLQLCCKFTSGGLKRKTKIKTVNVKISSGANSNDESCTSATTVGGDSMNKTCTSAAVKILRSGKNSINEPSSSTEIKCELGPQPSTPKAEHLDGSEFGSDSVNGGSEKLYLAVILFFILAALSVVLYRRKKNFRQWKLRDSPFWGNKCPNGSRMTRSRTDDWNENLDLPEVSGRRDDLHNLPSSMHSSLMHETPSFIQPENGSTSYGEEFGINSEKIKTKKNKKIGKKFCTRDVRNMI